MEKQKERQECQLLTAKDAAKLCRLSKSHTISGKARSKNITKS